MLRNNGKQSGESIIGADSTGATGNFAPVLLLKSVEFDDDVELLLSVAGLVMGPHVTSESGTHARTGANVAFCPGTFHGCALIF